MPRTWTLKSRRAQAAAMCESWRNPAHRAARLKSFVARSQKPSWKASRHRAAVAGSLAFAALCKDPVFQEKLRPKRVAATRRLFRDPAYRERHRVGVIKACKRPEHGKAVSAGLKLYNKKMRKAGKIPPRFLHRHWGPSKLEKTLVRGLRKVGLVCVAQYKVPSTWYTADIFVPGKNLIVEVDGHPSHYSYRMNSDRRKTRRLIKLGYRVLRLRTFLLKIGKSETLQFCTTRVLSECR